MKKKIIIGVVILGIVIFSVVFLNNTKKQMALPDTTYMITTASRTYFTDNITQDGKTYIMHTYYEKLNSKWVLQDRDLKLDPAVFGKVDVKGAKK